MKMKETTIPIGGVLRCCLSWFSESLHPEAEVTVGETYSCRYCTEEFTLTDKNEWIPTIFLEGESK